MAATVPVPTKSSGDVLTSSLWNTYLAGNLNKLLNQGHRVLTVSAFNSLSGLEDGDEVYLEVDATNGILWHLRYVAAEPTYKWRFLGGPPMLSEVVTSESLNSASYIALTTAGPAISLSRAGDYMVEVGAYVGASSSSADYESYMSYDIGGTGAVDADAFHSRVNGGGALTGSAGSRPRVKTGLAAAVTLTAKYRLDSATPNGTWMNRWMRVTPGRLI